MLTLFIFLKFLAMMFFKRNFIWVLLLMELIFMKMFSFIVMSLYLKYMFLFMFLVMAACGSVVGLSILMKMSRKKKKLFCFKYF